MIIDKYIINEENGVYLESYVPSPLNDLKRDAIIILPGGAYEYCSPREAEPIAIEFARLGFAPFVLNYTTNRKGAYPTQLREVTKAIKYIKDNSVRFQIDENRVFVIGFSAGGHLAASAATMWHRSEVTEGLGIEYGENKPLAVVLCYPVITADPSYAHSGSICNLLCKDDPSDKEREYVSCERWVDEKSSPAFIWHTAEDTSVPALNSINMAAAYLKAGVPFEMHIYPKGPHGASLFNDITKQAEKGREFTNARYARWIEDAAAFLKSI